MTTFEFKNKGKIWSYNGKVALHKDKQLLIYGIDFTAIYLNMPFSHTMTMFDYYLNHAMPVKVIKVRKEPSEARIKSEINKIGK